MNRVLRASLLLFAGLASLGAAPAWLATVATTAEGHRLGNPDAKVKVVAYESYTCVHCAEYEQKGAPELKLAYIQPGKVSLEVRHYTRDAVDLTAAMLTDCVPANKFFDAHRAIFLAYDKYAPIVAKAGKATWDRWTSPDNRAAGRRAIASDLGFYPIMAGQGLNRSAVDKCLGNQALADRISAQRKAIDDKFPNFSGTPSFQVNGVLLYATHEWSILKVQIDARL